MAAPSFSGITPVSYDGDVDWVIPATAVGIAPPGGKDTIASTFGNSARFIGRKSSDLLTAQTAVTLNLESVRAIYGVVGVSSSSLLNDEASGGLSAGISDSADNWKIFTVGGVDTVQSFRSFLIQAGQAPALSGGSIEESDISQIIVGYRGTAGVNTSNPKVLFDQVSVIDTPTLEGGEVGDEASFDSLTSLLSNTNLAAIEIIENSRIYKLQIPLEISAEVFDDSLGVLLFEDAGHLYIDNDYYYLRLNRPTATSTFILSDRQIASTLGLAIEVKPGCDTTLPIRLSNIIVEAPGTTTVADPMVWSGGSDRNRTLVRYQSGSITNSRLLVDSDLQIDCTPGQDLSGLSVRLSGTSQLLLNPQSVGDSAVNLTGLTAEGTAILDNLTATNLTVSVAAEFNHVVTSPTTGGGSVTVVAPPTTISAIGFPTGATVIVSQAGIQIDVLNSATAPYSYVTGTGGESGLIYDFKIVAAGKVDFTSTLNTAESNVVQYIGIDAGSEQTLDTPLFAFRELMGSNQAFLRVVDGDLSLVTQLWEQVNWQSEWNAAVVSDGPSAAEISTWAGYLATAGYANISFNSATGEVA